MLLRLRSVAKLILLLVFFFPSLLAAQRAYSSGQGSQYILFSGNISGDVSWAPDASPEGTTASCYGGSLGSFARTDLYVGVNPPWDPNPFFFELYHFASDCETSWCRTRDRILNLDFSSSGYTCIDTYDEEPCDFIALWWYYRPSVYLDLKNKSKIEQVEMGGETGYKVEGGSDSWVGNDSSNRVELRSSCDWLLPDGGVAGYSYVNFRWNASTPLNFTLSFTNTTASLLLTTTMLSRLNNLPVSTMVLSFSGSRNDTPTNSEYSSVHDQNPIELDTSDASTPRFNFVNNSNIFFTNISDTWSVAPTPIPTRTIPTSWKRASTSSSSSTSTASATGNGVGGTSGDVGVLVEIIVIVNVMICFLGM